METINVTMSNELIAFVKAQTALDGHASGDAYIRALILAERKRQVINKLEALLLEGLQGPSLPVDQDFWDSIRREALEELAKKMHEK